MFYDMKLMENSLLSGPWRAANYQEVNQSGNSNISNICETLDYLMTNDGNSPQGRLSLRASSVLVDGTVRLFKAEMNRLLQDTFKFSQQVVLNNDQRVWSEDSEDDLDTSLDDDEQVETSTELIRVSTNGSSDVSSLRVSSEDSEDDLDMSLDDDKQVETSTEIIRVPTNGDLLNSEGPVDEDWDEFERSCMNTQSDVGCAASETESEVNGNQINDPPHLQTSIIVKDMPSTQPTIKRDKAIQVSGELYGEESNEEQTDSQHDQHLPFGLVLMYNDNRSRAPTKILLSYLNPAVKNI